jgi:hypothetical protein
VIYTSSTAAPSGIDRPVDEDTSVLSVHSDFKVLNSEKQNATFQHITGGHSRTSLVSL